jgi:RNA recognition motif-containing protein
VKEVAVGTKLYVGSLPYSTTEQQLNELFSQHGTVQSAKVISDRYTGQSRGFGFVEMATSEEAQKAIAALNGTALGGRTLVVNEARPQEKRPYGGGGGGPAGGGGGEQRDRW